MTYFETRRRQGIIDWHHKVILWVSGFFILVRLPTDLWRLGYGGVNSKMSWVLNLSVRVPVALVVMIGVVFLFRRRGLRMDGFAVLLCYLLLHGTIHGGLRGISDHPNFQWNFFGAHFSGLLMILTSYVVFLNSPDRIRGWTQRYFNRLCPILLIVGVPCFMLFLGRRQAGVEGLNWGFTVPLLLPFAWALSQHRYFAALLSASIAVINGKRGVTLTIVVAAFAYAVLSFRSRKEHLTAMTIALMALGTVAAAFVVIPQLDTNALPGGIADTVGKWQEFGGDRLDIATSGRLGEFQTAMYTFKQEPINWALGNGYGWYFWITDPDGSQRPLHYVHFTPADFLFQYGLPLTITFFLLLAYRLARIFAYVASPTSTAMDRTLFIYLMSSVIGGMTGYTYVIDPLIWCFLGFLTARAERAGKKSVARPRGINQVTFAPRRTVSQPVA
jgi:hypothetical protein